MTVLVENEPSMTNDGSKKSSNDLTGIDETFRNLLQMVAALTIEGKREPMKWRLDQRGDWQKDDYDDQCRPQIGS